jgi:cation diffusion facilitator family transporter
MHTDNLQPWRHSHTFGQDRRRPGEFRTRVVIAITASMMVVEIAAGMLFGSMALLADGLHMASHAAALGINAFAYAYARRHAENESYSFGTGKVNALGGFSGAVLLVVFALAMGWESVARLVHPVHIVFDQAIFVAVLGLVVNGASVVILGVDDHHHGHDHGHEHTQHDDGHADHHHGGHAHGHDHNLRSAYLHVMADALTSVLAIVALLAAKFLGLVWMDPVMGIIGGLLVARWSFGLLRSTSSVLLDAQGPRQVEESIRRHVEDDDSRIADLHLWSIGPNVYAVAMTVVAHEPLTPDQYKQRMPDELGLAHVTIEVHECAAEPSYTPA